jgi:hypothetical protein
LRKIDFGPPPAVGIRHQLPAISREYGELHNRNFSVDDGEIYPGDNSLQFNSY